jgi:TolB protein
LAVNGERAGFEFLCLVQPDGNALREFTSHVEDGMPDWMSDGTRLVFGSTMHGDKQPRIYFIDEVPLGGGRVEGRVLRWEGGGEIRGEHPAWLPDGRIVFQACDPRDPGRCGLFVAGSESAPQAAVQITDHPSDTAPAARGSQILFMSERSGNWDLYSVSVSGGMPTRLTSSDAIEGLPAWSPDGRWIAYVSTHGGSWSVWALRRDGSGRRKLFDLGGAPGADWTQEQISWGP